MKSRAPVILLSYLIEIRHLTATSDSSCRATTGKGVPAPSVADASSMFNTRRDSCVED